MLIDTLLRYGKMRPNEWEEVWLGGREGVGEAGAGSAGQMMTI